MDNGRGAVGQLLVEKAQGGGSRGPNDERPRGVRRGGGSEDRGRRAEVDSDDMQALVRGGRHREARAKRNADRAILQHLSRLEARKEVRRQDVPPGRRAAEARERDASSLAAIKSDSAANNGCAGDGVLVVVAVDVGPSEGRKVSDHSKEGGVAKNNAVGASVDDKELVLRQGRGKGLRSAGAGGRGQAGVHVVNHVGGRRGGGDTNSGKGAMEARPRARGRRAAQALVVVGPAKRALIAHDHGNLEGVGRGANRGAKNSRRGEVPPREAERGCVA
jgi:hypothetical protein